jgi:AcrR family transcriptional regulator
MSPRISSDNREQYLQDKRDKILDAARAVFSHKGFAGANVSDIAEAAGIGKGTIYLYFKSKEDIFSNLLVEYSFIPRLVGHINQKEQTLREMLTNIAEDYLNHREEYIPLMRIAISELYRSREFAERTYDQIVNQACELLGSFLRDQIREGKIRETEDPYLSAQIFFGTLVTFIFSQELLAGKLKHNIPLEKWVSQVVDIYLKGVEV